MAGVLPKLHAQRTRYRLAAAGGGPGQVERGFVRGHDYGTCHPLAAFVDVGRHGGLYAPDREGVAHIRFVDLDHGMPVAVGVARSRHLRRQVRYERSERPWSSGRREGYHHRCREHREDHRGQQSSGLQSRHPSFLSLSSLLVRHRHDINNGATSCTTSFLSRFGQSGAHPLLPKEHDATSRSPPPTSENSSSETVWKFGIDPESGLRSGQEGSKKSRSAASWRQRRVLETPSAIFQTVSPRLSEKAR